MAHKLIALVLAILTTTAAVSGEDLRITGAYYDPIQAESGGEAVQLDNPTSTPIVLSTYTLATKQSTYPLPALTLLPGAGYLIADTGWDTLKDDPTWPAADLELGLSLANTDGFVELRDANGTVVDTLVWNSTQKAREGELYTKDGATTPFFRNSHSELHTIEAIITVLDGEPAIANVTVTDDVASESGVQLLSYNRTITITAIITDPNNGTVSATVTFLGKEYELRQNASNFVGEIPLSALAPGEYTLTITATDGSLTTEHDVLVRVLSSTSVRVSGELALAGAPGANGTGQFTITNNGNTQRRISITHTIPAGQCAPTTFTIPAGEEMAVMCSARIPSGNAGTRTYPVRILAS